MSFASLYLNRYSSPQNLIKEKPANTTDIIIIIPAFNESRLLKSLDSLYNCHPVNCGVEIIVNINWPENSNAQSIQNNNKSFEEATDWSKQHNTPNKVFHIIKSPDLPKKNAGVGLARKIAMDEAIRRFNLIQNPKGIIISFDADASCNQDYLINIKNHFESHKKTDGCSVYFEHPIEGKDYEKNIYEAIIEYELHLRYYLQSIRYAGHPNCFHTVGSSFAVKASAYCQVGGMNKRKAGEDFYFLQKVFDRGNFSECNNSTIIPSPRPSDRVPFGTGKAISKRLKEQTELLTYNTQLFEYLKIFISTISELEDFSKINIPILESRLPDIFKEWLNSINFKKILDEIASNSGSIDSFKKRFFRWFNMFQILKFLNFARNSYADIEISIAAQRLLQLRKDNFIGNTNKELLKHYRILDKKTTLPLPQ